MLCRGRAGYAKRGIHFSFGMGLKQQRNDNAKEAFAGRLSHWFRGVARSASDATTFITPRGELGLPKLANAGMQYGFERLARRCVPENAASEKVATKAAIGRNHFSAEGISNLGESRLARFDKLACEEVRVDERHAALSEERGSGGFSHADTAGKT